MSIYKLRCIMQLTAIDFNTILGSLRDAMPLLQRIASWTPWEQDDKALGWLQRFLDDPKSAEDELLGENGDNIRAGIRGVIKYIPDVQPFTLVKEFLEFVVADSASAMKAAAAAV